MLSSNARSKHASCAERHQSKNGSAHSSHFSFTIETFPSLLSPLTFCSPSSCHTLSPKLLRLLQPVLQAATDTKCCRTSTSTHCVREPHQPTSCKSPRAALGPTCSSWLNAGGALFVPRNRHPSTTIREQGIRQVKKSKSFIRELKACC